MTNSERIQDFLYYYRDFLKGNQIDVAHSAIKDEWFVYYYAEKYGHYEYFIKFNTVEELIDIILQELTFKLRCFLEDQAKTPDCEEDTELVEMVERYSKRNYNTSELMACLERILQIEPAQDSSFFNEINNLLKYKKETEQ